MRKLGFDNDKYVKMQSEHILEKIALFDNKLYLEFGGKLFDDLHASRVLPGFAPDAKIRLLQEMKDQTEIIVAINANDIERKKIRADYGITYDMDVMRLIDNLRDMGIYVSAIVLTQFHEQPSAALFKKKLEIRGERVFIHRVINGYPNDVDTIVSENGYGANEYIPTTRPLVVVTAPGPGSGKLATCLNQLYHEHKRNVRAGYAKFETFPIWSLPLKHPVNIAYEAATADLKDVNMIDPYHLEAYGKTTVNYNRDVEAFPVVKTIISRITGRDNMYLSPTDMGVNMAGFCITDDEACREASRHEVIRRYYKAACDYKNGLCDIDVVHRIEALMQELGVSPTDRIVVRAALEKEKLCDHHVVSLMLPDGKIVTGKSSPQLSASAAALLNAVQELAGLPDELHLISPAVFQPIADLRKSIGSSSNAMSLHETLVALSSCAATNADAALALSKLPELRFCEGHSTKMLRSSDEAYFKRLRINMTSEAEFISNNLYIQ